MAETLSVVGCPTTGIIIPGSGFESSNDLFQPVLAIQTTVTSQEHRYLNDFSEILDRRIGIANLIPASFNTFLAYASTFVQRRFKVVTSTA